MINLLIGTVIATAVFLLILYLTRPRYEPIKLSAAAFFDEAPDATEQSFRFRLNNLLLSRAFWLQLAVLTCLLAALWLRQQTLAGAQRDALGIWLLVDTSGSMSSSDGNTTYFEQATQEAVALTQHLQRLASDVTICANITAFDLALRPLMNDVPVSQIDAAMATLAPRSLGTDLALVRGIVAQAAIDNPAPDICPITHVVVLTDNPAPDWLAEPRDAPLDIIWRDVGDTLPNVGIRRVMRTGGAVLGWDGDITIEAAYYGNTPSLAALTVQDAAGATIAQIDLTWALGDSESHTISLPAAGQYDIVITPGGAYAGDDRLTIQATAAEQIRVDWQLPDITWLNALAWTLDTAAPDVRVLPYQQAMSISADDGVPVLWVGDQYGRNATSQPIAFFVQDSPLLEGLNFDVAETLAIQGITLPDVSPLRPVLLDANDGVWLAQSLPVANDMPPMAYVPGLPLASGPENARAFSTTAFFNALRWLLRERTLPPLYTLTTPDNPEPAPGRAALHDNEGQTALPDGDAGAIADIQPVQTVTDDDPLWLVPLLMAFSFFLIERLLSIYGSPRWR